MVFSRNRLTLALTCFLFIFFAGIATGKQWTLAENGMAKSVVLLREKATVIERHAAAELCYFLSKTTGAQITQSKVPVEGKYSIWIGIPDNNPAPRIPSLKKRVESVSEQGFLLYADAEGLVITGSNPLGVLFGTYAFLEEYVGIRWFFPGEDGEYCPNLPVLRINGLDDLQEPSFERREVHFSKIKGRGKTLDTWNWIARNRMQSQFYPEQREEYEKRGASEIGGGHILYRMVPGELFNNHPEYFAMYNGKRQKYHTGQDNIYENIRSQPCLSNPNVKTLVTDYMINWFKKNPDGEFLLDANDYSRFCECDKCVAMDPKEEEKLQYVVSTRWFTFVNEIASRVWSVYPNAQIRTRAYARYRIPPIGVEPDSRLWVELCDHGRCFRHSLDDLNCKKIKWMTGNEPFREMFEGWSKFNVNRTYFPYYNMIGCWRSRQHVPEGGIISVPMSGIVASDMRYMHRLGHKGWVMRVRPPDGKYSKESDRTYVKEEWRANFDWFFVQAKLAWNIKLKVDDILADMYGKYYGPAAKPMIGYHKLLQRAWEETPGHYVYGQPFSELVKTIMMPGVKTKLQAFLNEATKAAESTPVYARRVAKSKLIFENSWLLAEEKYVEEHETLN
jgi:hypothetical protein